MTEAITQAEPSAKRNGSWWKQLLAFVFAGGLLWFTFKDIDMNQMLVHLKSVNLFWLSLVCLSSLVSHILRAIRWAIFLEPVAGRKVSIWNTFLALMICYSVNIVIPRGGEVVRLVTISKKENISWAGALPTMFIDRLLDLAFLAIFTGITLPLLPSSIIEKLPWLIPAGVSLCIAALVGLVLLPKAADLIRLITSRPFIKSKLPEGILHKLDDLTEQFRVGTSCLTSASSYPIIAGLSAAIWGCYLLNSYLMFGAFGLQNQIDIKQLIGIFTIGSVGVVIPTPGCVGSFHAGTTLAISLLTNIDPNVAAAYATLLHAVTFILLTALLTAICLVIDNFMTNNSKTSGQE